MFTHQYETIGSLLLNSSARCKNGRISLISAGTCGRGISSRVYGDGLGDIVKILGAQQIIPVKVERGGKVKAFFIAESDHRHVHYVGGAREMSPTGAEPRSMRER